jgi:hypothetical protein
MNGLNTSFITDPVRFLRANPVNVSSILPRAVGAVGVKPQIDTIKYGMFDLTQDGSQVWFKQMAMTATSSADGALLGYWCPFAQSNGAAGYVDVPKLKPLADFVFTAAMNGCSLIVTASPVADCFRVYHHQHPEGTSRAIVNTASGITEQSIIFEFNSTLYDAPTTTGGFYQAFNFLKFEDKKWKIYSQYTKLALSSGGTVKIRTVISTASLDLSRAPIVRDLAVA